MSKTQNLSSLSHLELRCTGAYNNKKCKKLLV